MEISILKHEMKSLWKEIFHDSDTYIDLLFDNYFNPDFIEYEEGEGKLISSLLGIPYVFSDGKFNLKGLYLCGLSTRPEFRGMGKMSGLIHKLALRIKDKVDFLFLIPSNSEIIEYYLHRKFQKGIYRIIERYTGLHDFKKDFLTRLKYSNEIAKRVKLTQFESLNINKLIEKDSEAKEKIIEFLLKEENKQKNYFKLCHTGKDYEIIIKENLISGGEIFYVADSSGEVKAVAFLNNDKKKIIEIPFIVAGDQISYYRLMDEIVKLHPDVSFELYRIPEEVENKVVISKHYIGPDLENDNLESPFRSYDTPYYEENAGKTYGLVKILNQENFISALCAANPDVSFRIAVKNFPDFDDLVIYDVYKGNLKTYKERIGSESVLYNNKNMTLIDYEDLNKMILRKKENDDIIEDIFGVPNLNLRMWLLLD